MVHRYSTIAWLIGAALASVVPERALAQVPTLVSRTVVRIPAGTRLGPSELLIQADGVAAGSTERPVVKDTGTAPTTTFASAIDIPTGDRTRRLWRVPVAIAGFSSDGLMLPRTAEVTLGDQTPLSLQYWVSNLAAPVLSWRFDGLPAEWSISSGCHALRITASGARATGIIVTSTLVEEKTKQPLLNLFLSLDQHAPASSVRLESAVNDNGEAVYLCMPADPPPGKFIGNINVSAAEKPEGTAAGVIVHSTNRKVQILGTVLLLVGGFLALVFRVWAPGVASRAQALLAATTLRERGTEMRAAIDALAAPATKYLLEDIIGSLRPSALEDKLPPSIPSPFGGSSTSNDTFKKFIDEQAERLQKLRVIVAGLLRAVQAGSPTSIVEQLDNLAPGIDTLPIAEIRSRVFAILSSHEELERSTAEVTEPTSQQLTLLLERVSLGVWLMWFGMTFAIGLGVLILNNPSFGIPIDFLYCALWGFGVPAAGQQLTNTSATTALNITLPARP